MKTILLSFSALAMVVGAPAVARDFVVVHDDLDLSSKRGQKALDQRITSQARKYCGMDKQLTGTRIATRSADVCFRSARDAAREQMQGLVERAQKGG